MNKPNQSIIHDIMMLCDSLKHSEAIALTNQTENKTIAIKAHLLCIEHEQRCRLDGKLPRELSPQGSLQP